MRALDRLLGRWEFTMGHCAMAEPVIGTHVYERVLDGAFVLLRWTYEHPDFPDAMALISDDQYHYFDVRGLIRIFQFEIHDAGWSMIRVDDDFSQRTVARFEGPDRTECTGDASSDRGITWRHDFSMAMRSVG